MSIFMMHFSLLLLEENYILKFLFAGSLYTTAPTTSEFLKDIVSETNEH